MFLLRKEEGVSLEIGLSLISKAVCVQTEPLKTSKKILRCIFVDGTTVL